MTKYTSFNLFESRDLRCRKVMCYLESCTDLVYTSIHRISTNPDFVENFAATNH